MILAYRIFVCIMLVLIYFKVEDAIKHIDWMPVTNTTEIEQRLDDIEATIEDSKEEIIREIIYK